MCAVHRKAHLWDREKLFFVAGICAPPVVQTASGRVGVAVCYDAFFPEVMRMLGLAGADVITVPMNSPVFGAAAGAARRRPGPRCAGAQVSRVVVAQADRSGTERGVEWSGRA